MRVCRSKSAIQSINKNSKNLQTVYAAENLATFRRLALNMLGSGKGLLERRKRADWDEKYLTEVIRKFFIKTF